MSSIEQRITEFAAIFNILEIVVLFFLLLIISETIWDAIVGERKTWRESAANYLIGVGNALLEGSLSGVVFIVGLAIAETFAPFTIAHSWWSWALAIFVADFSYYWMHRIEHQTRILWANHSVHHSSPEFNLTTSLRICWLDGFIEWLFFVPMILLGFDLIQTIVGFSVVIAYQTWIHTEKIGKLGFLDKIFNTPSVHRVHHGSNPQYIDRNYGGILILWDRMLAPIRRKKKKLSMALPRHLAPPTR